MKPDRPTRPDVSKTIVSNGGERRTESIPDEPVIEETFVLAEDASELKDCDEKSPCCGNPDSLEGGENRFAKVLSHNEGSDAEWPEPRRFGRYLLLGLIGRGGMGEVYRAMHVRLQKPVALKILAAHREGDERARIRFAREVRALCELSHPNLVRIETAGEHEGLPYLVMEHVDGIDLERLVDVFGPLEVADACQLVGQAALGLAHLHEKQQVHRDIKPSNLIVDASGVVKIADLGTVLDTSDDSELTPVSRVVGDPHYVPPEYLDKDQSDATIQGDLYSLGCTLFTLLAGYPPFHYAGPDPTGILKARMREAFPRIADVRDDVPIKLQNLLDGMTSSDPRKRPEHPMQVVAVLAPLAVTCDLESLLAGVQSRDVLRRTDDSMSSAEYLRTQAAESAELRRFSSRSKRWWSVPLVLASILVVAGGIGLASYSTRSPGETEDGAADSIASLNLRDKAHAWDPAGGESEWSSGIAYSPIDVNANPSDSKDQSDRSARWFDWVEDRRDAIDLRMDASPSALTLTNLETRGLVQMPLVMPDRYTLELTVERLAGSGSFGIGLSVGSGRLLAIVDHLDEGQTISGMMSVDARGVRQVADPHATELLPKGQPIRMRLRVSPDHAELLMMETPRQIETQSQTDIDTADPSSDESEITSITQWQVVQTEDAAANGDAEVPQLRQFDAFYPDVLFFHVFQGSFQVRDLEIADVSTAVRRQPFRLQDATFERQLAERIVWRGGHVEIITESATKIVHGLEQLSDAPWLLAVEKCGAAPRLAIGDAELRELAQVKGLRRIELYDSDVSAAAIASLSGMQGLHTLVLAGNRIDASGVSELRDLPGLRKLQLLGMTVPDEALAAAARFRGLTSFCLSDSRFSEGVLGQMIPGLTNLQHFCLSRTGISGDCLQQLSKLRHLQQLQLDGTTIDDDAVAALADLPSLESLALADTVVSDEAVSWLENQRPGLKVDH